MTKLYTSKFAFAPAEVKYHDQGFLLKENLNNNIKKEIVDRPPILAGLLSDRYSTVFFAIIFIFLFSLLLLFKVHCLIRLPEIVDFFKHFMGYFSLFQHFVFKIIFGRPSLMNSNLSILYFIQEVLLSFTHCFKFLVKVDLLLYSFLD